MSAAGTAREPGLEHRLTSAAGLLLVVAVAVGLVGLVGYYDNGQRLVGLLVGGAVLLALVARPPTRNDLWRLPVAPALALGGWALLDPVALGAPVAGGIGLVLLLGGSWARWESAGGSGRRTVTCCWPRSWPRAWWLPSVAGWGCLAGRVAGVAGWRDLAASATLTYPNVAAAVLAPVALVILARLDRSPPPLALVVTATGSTTRRRSSRRRSSAAGPTSAAARPTPRRSGSGASPALVRHRVAGAVPQPPGGRRALTR